MKLSIAVLIVGALALVGCFEKSSSDQSTSRPPVTRSGQEQSWPQHYMRLVEKGGVQCIVYDFGNTGGISCNWEKYNGTRSASIE